MSHFPLLRVHARAIIPFVLFVCVVMIAEEVFLEFF